MKTGWMLCAVLSAALPPVPGTASAACLCRANGTQYEEGELACLKLPSGHRLARCEKVLNNTSWKILGDNCTDLAMLPGVGGPAAWPTPSRQAHPQAD